MNLGESLLDLGSTILVDDPEFYLAVCNSYLSPQLKETGGWGTGGKTPGGILPQQRCWEEAG